MRGAFGVWLLSLCFVLGCGGANAASSASGSLALRTLPAEAEQRRAAIESLAQQTFEALRDGVPRRLLAPANELDGLLTASAQHRLLEQRRTRLGALPVQLWAVPWKQASFTGFCAQGAREETAGGPSGLKEPAWVLDRLLVAATFGGQRSASWVEGSFVYTTDGFRALNLSRLEGPRNEHSDLELAPCDVEGGLR